MRLQERNTIKDFDITISLFFSSYTEDELRRLYDTNPDMNILLNLLEDDNNETIEDIINLLK